MTISIPIWVLILLIITNVFVWLAILLITYFVFGVLDLTYHERHKQTKSERDCPDEIDK